MVRYCDVCSQTKDNIKNLGMNEQESEYYKGYLAIWDKPSEIICPCCKQGTPIETNLTIDEFNIITKASMYNRQFLEAMIELKEKDIVEYQLKMSQFKAQNEQAKKAEQSSNNQVKCPRCKSTSITTGARGVNFIWGLIGASKTVNRCANCGHTWKP